MNLKTFKKIPYVRPPSGQPEALVRHRLIIAQAVVSHLANPSGVDARRADPTFGAADSSEA